MTTVGVCRESAPGERRVAMVPQVVPKLVNLGVTVLVEAGAGGGALESDSAYRQAGAEIVEAAELDRQADILLCVGPPAADRLARLRSGQVLLGLLEPATRPALLPTLAAAGVTTISLDQLPRTLSRAQAMDVLSSQANLAGYKAAILAADTYGRFFPMLMTAAGTARPAQVLVLGVGVAGLAAIGTARRLGAVVSAYDIRPQARAEAVSVGARYLDLAGPDDGAAQGGYARELTAAERQAQQDALQQRIAEFDVVITTAQVPGRRPPVLVTAAALKGMRPGSVVLDLAAGPLGGNVEGSRPDATACVADGVTVIGAGNLPSMMAPAASAAYARNVSATLAHLLRDGAVAIEVTDEIQRAIVLTHAGALTPAGTALAGAAGAAGSTMEDNDER